MKKMFKKIVASVMAVSTLSVGTIGMNVNAYGNTDTFTVNGVSVTKSIDAYKSSASAYTNTTSQKCSFVYVSLTCDYSSTGSKSDHFSATRGKVRVSMPAESGKSFSKAKSYHSATVSGVSDDRSMTVYV